MTPSATLKSSIPSAAKKIRFNTPIVIGVTVAIVVVLVALLSCIFWRTRRHVKASNKIRHEAVEAHYMLSQPPK